MSRVCTRIIRDEETLINPPWGVYTHKSHINTPFISSKRLLTHLCTIVSTTPRLGSVTKIREARETITSRY